MSRERAWSKFWWEDWQSDPALCQCSLAAQGLWMRMLCIMNQSERPGYLLLNGRAMTAEELNRVVRSKKSERFCKILDELRVNGVCSIDEHGVIFSRRMVRDAQKRQQSQEFGKMGGNPSLKGGLTPPLKGRVKLEAEAEAEAEKKEAEKSPPLPPTNGKAPADRGSRLPPDWQPSPEDCAFAVEHGLSPANIAAAFRDYWHSKPGSAGLKLDWSATWRTWCRNERAPQSRTKSVNDQIAEDWGLGSFLNVPNSDDDNNTPPRLIS